MPLNQNGCGDILHTHLSFKPLQALTCCTVEVKTLDDRLLNIPINDIVQ